MWNNTRMVVLVALSASLYAAAIVVFRTPSPFQTRFIGQLLPMPMSLLFGPAGAWGVVLGGFLSQLIAGEMQVGTVLALLSSLVLGATPYCLWSRLWPIAVGSRQVSLASPRDWTLFFCAAISSAFACAIVIAWMSDLLGLAPFRFLALLIGVQDAIQGSVSALLFVAVHRRVEALGLAWWEVVEDRDLDAPTAITSRIGAWIVFLAALILFPVTCAIAPDSARIVGGVATALILSGLLLMW